MKKKLTEYCCVIFSPGNDFVITVSTNSSLSIIRLMGLNPNLVLNSTAFSVFL